MKSRMGKKILLFVTFAILVMIALYSNKTFAGIGIMETYGSIVIPLQENHSIKILKQVVKVLPDYTVKAVYTFENSSKDPVTLKMGVPSNNKMLDSQGACSVFITKVNGKKVHVSSEKTPQNIKAKIGSDFGWINTWTVNFKPKERKIVKCNYMCSNLIKEAEFIKGEPNLASGYIDYITKPGILWGSPIIKADIYIDVTGYTGELSVVKPKGYKGNRFKVEWHFRNWKPTENIHIEIR